MTMEMPEIWQELKECVDDRYHPFYSSNLSDALDLMREMARALEYQIDFYPADTSDKIREALKKFKEWK